MIEFIIIYLIDGLIFGFITWYVSRSKGYDGGFAWGFFLGIIGLLVVGFRPNLTISTPETENYTLGYGTSYNTSSSTNMTTSSGTWVCECGASNSNSLNYCLRCRRERNPVTYQPKITCPHCGAQNRATNTVCFACNKPLKEEIVVVKEENKQDVTMNGIELLQQLSKLHEQGVLTEEEFQAKKAEILARM